MDSFFFGLDLGQANDYSALCIAERTGEGREPSRYTVPWLERFPLHTSYQNIVAGVAGRIHSLASRQPRPSIRLVVDSTGVGRPVVNLLRAARLPCTLHAVTITGGNQEIQDADDWNVPKRDLVSTAQVLLQGGRLKIAEALPEAATLTRELLAFKVTISPAGHDSYAAWRESDHDDLVLAAALACWMGEHGGDLPFAWLRNDPAFRASVLGTPGEATAPQTDAERIAVRRAAAGIVDADAVASGVEGLPKRPRWPATF